MHVCVLMLPTEGIDRHHAMAGTDDQTRQTTLTSERVLARRGVNRRKLTASCKTQIHLKTTQASTYLRGLRFVPAVEGPL